MANNVEQYKRCLCYFYTHKYKMTDGSNRQVISVRTNVYVLTASYILSGHLGA